MIKSDFTFIIKNYLTGIDRGNIDNRTDLLRHGYSRSRYRDFQSMGMISKSGLNIEYVPGDRSLVEVKYV